MNALSKLSLVAVLAAASAVAGCDDKKTDGTTPSASAAVTVTAPPASAVASASAAPTTTAPPADPNALPSQATEAQKAAQEIDKANYKSELDKLDKEIGK